MFGLRAPEISTGHTGSYYAASVNRKTDYPRLEGDHTADVVVVGGGFTGANLALELAERGMDVALVEAHRIGWGASGRNGGQIIGGLGHDPERFVKTIGEEGVKAIYGMGLEGREIIAERVERYGIECDLKWGYCDVALKPRHMKQFAEWRDFEKQIGNPHTYRLLDRDELKHYVNSDRYLGGLYNDGNGHIHPLNLCIGEAAALEQLGGRIFEQSKVTDIEYGARTVIRTEQGSISAKRVVLAGNAYMGGLVPKLATRVLPSCSSVIGTEPLSEEMAREILPGDVAVCDPRTALDYFRLSGDNRLLFGGLSNYTGLEPRDLHGVMRKKLAAVYPQLADVRIDFAWSGWIGIGINRMPQLGHLSDNVSYIQAYSGHGVCPTHIMARITAEMLAGDPRRFDIMASIRHMPFPGGKLLRRPGLALGMAYYKLLDAL
ncbi:gamma-glutamylputrescine oxidoreductase [Luminiphilus syltensis NOR5-1B]|uniref:Gamma-glutamylputrescine oxidoreductase n=1 Tax=Luminiphilus syltensis NOR5-1B TaxID=565045 RepID=B8KTU6_9GAMM|nr:FAD-binding oxidoreductase [Luminiphilus syltensis]EED35093.1 gamma-glutamylputrescine oxidoreductase [Luminiphilus syltensis NOR5-1B]